MLEYAIVELLMADATCRSMTDGDGTSAIRPAAGVQGVDRRPMIIYNVTSGDSTATYQGPSTYQKANFELVFYTDSFADCVRISAAAKGIFDGMANTTTKARIAPSMLEDETDIQSVTQPGTDKQIYVRQQTYRALYRAV